MRHQEKVGKLIKSVEKVIKGKREAVEYAIFCLLSGGHLLIEDPPGVGKTVLAKAIARSINGTFKRIQFTPDLLPSDITGVNIYRARNGDFHFIPGPIFANIVLADELNRTTPRTQSALLESMEEGCVTVEGESHLLPQPFFVVATQNPLEQYGTYPLPEGQLDRFLISISLGYPDSKVEEEVVRMQLLEHPLNSLQPVLEKDEVLEVQKKVREVTVSKEVLGYAVKIVRRTRNHPKVFLGASPRGSIFLVRLAQAVAFYEGRDFILPDDVKKLAPLVLSHRLSLKASFVEDKGVRKEIIREVLEKTPVPVRL
jgi:MoxR-like ATPase